MSSCVTIARPYAKAVFELALEQGKLKIWATALHTLAVVMSDVDAIHFLENPATTHEQQISFLNQFISSHLTKKKTVDESIVSFITVLVRQKRLMVLPAVSILFEQMRADYEKTLDVAVISFSALSKRQESELCKRLKKRLKRDVTLKVSIDHHLLGGAIIQAGDLVIDGSIRGELNKLKANLVA